MIRWTHTDPRIYEAEVYKNGMKCHVFIWLFDGHDDAILEVWSAETLYGDYLHNRFMLHCALPRRRITSTASKLLKKNGFTQDYGKTSLKERLAYLLYSARGR